MSLKKVLITGITGQDGSYMADYLLKDKNNKSIRVYGAMRRVSKPNYENCHHLLDDPRFSFIDMDVSDPVSVNQAVITVQPDYFINFAANSFVGNSWDMPVNHFQTNAIGVLNCLEAIRLHRPLCRFYSAGSSEEWGNIDYYPQDEKHPLKPRSPYGASKVSARMMVKVYRESYKMYAVQGWLLNHESERRGEEFVTQKIASGVARIFHALNNKADFQPILLGNLDAKRDWSHAYDFMSGIWSMLHQESFRPAFGSTWQDKIDNLREYVLASGETHTVREFVERAFGVAGISGEWKTKSLPFDEQYVLSGDENITLVKISPEYYRPAEVDLLLGDPTKAKLELSWSPTISFDELVKKMVLNKIKKYE